MRRSKTQPREANADPSGRPRLLAAACLIPILCSSCTMAVHSAVRDQSGQPLQDAVVYAMPKEPRLLPAAGNPKAVIAVEGYAFKPPVLPVRVGTGVSFLNRDDIKHQIYSISAARNFELPTERLSKSPAVVFDKPGVVVLGLALHDRSVGHICVLETPYFVTTGADGRAELDGLPRGAYEVRVWHPGMKSSAAATTQHATDSPSHRVDLDFTISAQHGRPLEEVPPPVPAPGGRGK